MKTSRRRFLALQVLAPVFLGAIASASPAQQSPRNAGQNAPLSVPILERWGLETLQEIDKTLWLPTRKLYSDKTKTNEAPRDAAFAWAVGVHLSAMIAAAQIEPKWVEPTRAYADAIEVYWNEQNGLGGYDVLPVPKQLDRYYDDNEWIVLNQIELWELLKDPKFRDRAERTFRFVMSGEDAKLGGGIYWKEDGRDSKNTCSNAPAVVAAMRLYGATKQPKYLQIAQRIYQWTNANLQDKDGLFWDNIKLDGKIDKTKFSYNSALMIRANCLLFAHFKDRKYLREAQRIGRAAQQKWVVAESGTLDDGGRFGHLFMESLFALYEQDRDPNWLRTAQSAMPFLYSQVRDVNGHYPDSWRKPTLQPLQEWSLIDQSSAARVYLETARVLRMASTAK